LGTAGVHHLGLYYDSVSNWEKKMTNEEFEKRWQENEEIEKKLKEMSELPEKDRPAYYREIAIKYGVYNFAADGARDTYTLFQNIHIYFQSKLMLNACVFAAESSKSAEESSKLAEESSKLAKQACIWAAVAAIAACISIVVMLCSN
jgi:hypothetical protein